MRERPSGEAQRFEPKDRNIATDVELRQSNSITDKKEEGAVREPLTSSGEVRISYSICIQSHADDYIVC